MSDRAKGEDTAKQGKVFLVGAGPGDPGLITMRGVACLRQADVAIYDYLVATDLLDHLPPQAERIFAGKLAGNHVLKQTDINQLLVDKAREGKQVVRLKGGDPFVFGRGGEECMALVDAGIPFEVVPGICAAVGVSAYAGIPVTQRGHASSLYLVTAHLTSKGAELNVNWEQLARAGDTLCIYMGMRILPEISGQLQEHGCAPDTPVAAIQWGTHLKQRTITGTLRDIADRVKQAQLSRPGIIIVGDVVRFRDQLNWFERRPLFGRRILIHRMSDQAEELASRFQALGADVLPLPLGEVVPSENLEPFDKAICDIENCDWIIFRSPRSVRFFLGRLVELGHDVRRLSGVRICAMGDSTVHELRAHHLRADLIPPDMSAESCVNVLAQRDDLRGKKFLVLRSNLGEGTLRECLEACGAFADVVVTHRIVPIETAEDEWHHSLKERKTDWIICDSSLSVHRLFDLLRPVLGEEKLREVKLASTDQRTSDELREIGWPPTVEGGADTSTGLLEAVANHELNG